MNISSQNEKVKKILEPSEVDHVPQFRVNLSAFSDWSKVELMSLLMEYNATSKWMMKFWRRTVNILASGNIPTYTKRAVFPINALLIGICWKQCWEKTINGGNKWNIRLYVFIACLPVELCHLSMASNLSEIYNECQMDDPVCGCSFGKGHW